MDILPDLLQPDLCLVFCGTAASEVSAARKAYYANPTNRFWHTLAAVGLTSRLLLPEEYPLLLDYRIGLTDLAKQAQGSDRVLRPADFDAGTFWQKMLRCSPRHIAFTSKTAASIALDQSTRDLLYGRQPQQRAGMTIWVLPSPSGAARSYWQPAVWQTLADFIREG